jgi:hypothetical protein
LKDLLEYCFQKMWIYRTGNEEYCPMEDLVVKQTLSYLHLGSFPKYLLTYAVKNQKYFLIIPRLNNGEKFAIFKDLLKKKGKVRSILPILTGKSYPPNVKYSPLGSFDS